MESFFLNSITVPTTAPPPVFKLLLDGSHEIYRPTGHFFSAQQAAGRNAAVQRELRARGYPTRIDQSGFFVMADAEAADSDDSDDDNDYDSIAPPLSEVPPVAHEHHQLDRAPAWHMPTRAALATRFSNLHLQRQRFRRSREAVRRRLRQDRRDREELLRQQEQERIAREDNDENGLTAQQQLQAQDRADRQFWLSHPLLVTDDEVLHPRRAVATILGGRSEEELAARRPWYEALYELVESAAYQRGYAVGGNGDALGGNNGNSNSEIDDEIIYSDVENQVDDIDDLRDYNAPNITRETALRRLLVQGMLRHPMPPLDAFEDEAFVAEMGSSFNYRYCAHAVDVIQRVINEYLGLTEAMVDEIERQRVEDDARDAALIELEAASDEGRREGLTNETDEERVERARQQAEAEQAEEEDEDAR